MFERHIDDATVRHVLLTGEIIELYPNDIPLPSRLMLGWRDTRPIHIVAADNTAADETIVITVYQPDPIIWEPDFRRRRR